MSAMYRLKAYFGMVPAEEMGEYLDEPAADRYPPSRRSSRDDDGERWDDRHSSADADLHHHDDSWNRRSSRSSTGDRAGVRLGSGTGPSGLVPPSTRGALAIDPDVARAGSRPGPVVAVPEQRGRPAGRTATFGRITTVQPRSYNEARAIGERYRDGVPVIMNLTDLDDAAAKRLVDFAAGLAFALRGSINKVTNRVFLLTPVDVEVSADQARKLAERSGSGARIDTERSGSGARMDTERSGSGARMDTERSGSGARVDAERGFFRQD